MAWQQLDLSSYEQGYRLGSAGEAFPHGGHRLSDFIEAGGQTYLLAAGDSYTYNSSNERYVALAFYDASKRFISRPVMTMYDGWNDSSWIVERPEEAAYVRVSAPNDTYSSHLQLFFESGGGGSMISDPIQLFDYDDSYVGWITTNIGAVDPHTTYSQGANGERYGGVRDAEPGQVFEISIDATPTSGNYLWFCLSFYDSDMKQLARPTKTSAVGDTHMEMATTAPANTAYMRPSARFYSDGFLSVETSGGGVDSMTTFAEGKARNLALGTEGTVIDNLDGANPSSQGYRPEYAYFDTGNTLALEDTARLTVSFDLVMTVATANPALQVYNTNNKGPMAFSGVNALAGEKHAVGETIEKRVAVTGIWSPRSDANRPTNFLEFYSTYGTGNYFSISNLMVELGEVAHPWRPAPEDLEGASDVILATDSKTLAVTVDVQKVETFYYQTASTSSAPAKPTTATPSGWQATEHAFDATKAVWTCQKTTLTDGTFRWGEVSKSSAYEGAVVSRNAADAAQTTANSANAREQRIYKSAASGTASMAATTTWIASTADVQNAWTAKRPSFDRSYPVLFTATQRQTVAQQAAGSNCSCTTPYVDESAAVAGNYITKVGTGGDAWVHSEGHGPDSNGAATSDTYGWRIGSVFELVRAGLSYLKMWVDGTAAKVRVGLEDEGNSVFSPEGMEVFTDADTSVAKFGESVRIGPQDGLHQEITGTATSYINGSDTVAYVSTDKFYSVNSEVEDAFYIGNYSVRNASDGKLVIGLRR